MAKFYTEQKRKETNNTIDMLDGCINRICVTDDNTECDRMFCGAMIDITKIRTTHRERILEYMYGDKETRDANQRKMQDIIFDRTIDDDTRSKLLAEISSHDKPEGPRVTDGYRKPADTVDALKDCIKYLVRTTNLDEFDELANEAMILLSDLYQEKKAATVMLSDLYEEYDYNYED